MRNFFLLFIASFLVSGHLKAANRLQVNISRMHCSKVVASANRVLGFAIELPQKEIELLSQNSNLGIKQRFTSQNPSSDSSLTVYTTTAEVSKFLEHTAYGNVKLAYKLPRWRMVSSLWDVLSFAGFFTVAWDLAVTENKEPFFLEVPPLALSVMAVAAPVLIKLVKDALLYNVNYALNGKKITSAKKAFRELAKQRMELLSDGEHVSWVMNFEDAGWPFQF